jgi:hypothetical protein
MTHIRYLLAVVLLAVGLSGCGGGGGSGDAQLIPSPVSGTVVSRNVASKFNLTNYPIRVYLPPAGVEPVSKLPVVYALDGDSWFDLLVSIAESTRSRVLIVGIGNNAQRNRDYVPVNTCTAGGGGNEAFFNFLRQELTPFVEGTLGGDPTQRILIGHSHGGSFVIYAMFAEPPQARSFQSYLASDSSIDCLPQTLAAWENAYAAAYTEMPARVHISHTSIADGTFASRLASHGYTGLALKEQVYAGTHNGIVPAAFADALAFALGK